MSGDIKKGSGDKKPLLRALSGQAVSPNPIWLMRQAGRYLPEYRALRAKAGGFLAMVYDPAVAAEITLQPLRRFALDAAILFSDILIVPHAMGQGLRFETGEGPILEPVIRQAADIAALHPEPERFAPIYETVRQVRAQLSPDAALIGFAGSPWTVATYMIEGRGGDQTAARRWALADPSGFSALIEQIEAVTLTYLKGQIAAGAEAVQLFDSWSGALSAAQFVRWVVEPTARLVQALHAFAPTVPVIGFPRGAGAKLVDYVEATNLKAVGVDESMDLAFVARHIPPSVCVQGNIDPQALFVGGAVLAEAVDRALDAMAGRPYIVNLGHGIHLDTPPEHVTQLINRVKDSSR